MYKKYLIVQGRYRSSIFGQNGRGEGCGVRALPNDFEQFEGFLLLDYTNRVFFCNLEKYPRGGGWACNNFWSSFFGGILTS